VRAVPVEGIGQVHALRLHLEAEREQPGGCALNPGYPVDRESQRGGTAEDVESPAEITAG